MSRINKTLENTLHYWENLKIIIFVSVRALAWDQAKILSELLKEFINKNFCYFEEKKDVCERINILQNIYAFFKYMIIAWLSNH